MPKIEIETCSKTPTLCALEAITKVIRQNYTQRKSRHYQYENIIKVESGRILKVMETPGDIHAESPCSCKFKVEVAET